VSTVREVSAPHLFDDEAELFSEALNRHGHRYLEFGMGGSTVLAAKRCSLIVAVDSDNRWIETVSAQPDVAAVVAADRAALLHADIGPLQDWGFPADRSAVEQWSDYIRLPWAEWARRGEKPNLVFVDGRFRLACCLSVVVAVGATRALGTSPRVLLHDFDAARSYYRPVLDYFEVESARRSLHLLRMQVDASPVAAMATMLRAMSDPR
jgi:hypothetical protein